MEKYLNNPRINVGRENNIENNVGTLENIFVALGPICLFTQVSTGLKNRKSLVLKTYIFLASL